MLPIRLRLVLACTVLGLATIGIGEEAKAETQSLDGLYFPHGGRRLLRIEGHRFSLWNGDFPYDHEIRGAKFDHTFIFFDGFKEVQVQATLAIVDEHLWAGVLLRKKRPEGQEFWQSQFVGGPFFGPSGEYLGDDLSVEWRPDDGYWRYIRIRPKETLNYESRNVEVVRDPRSQNGTDRFLLMTPVNPGENGSTPYILNEWELTISKKKYAEKHGQEDQWFDEFYSFTRKGDVILTPWSVNLGRVGLCPAQIEKKDVLGSWVDEADGTLVEFVEKEATNAPHLQVFLGQKRFGQQDLDEMLKRAWYEPGRFGEIHYTVGWNCGMGHFDYPFHFYWIPLSKSRMARMVSNGGCNRYGKPQQMDLRFFKKKE